MRKLILMISSFYFTTACLSQVNFAIKAGMNIGSLTKAYQTGFWQNNTVLTPNAKALVGFYGGFFTEIDLTKNILIRPELITSNPVFKTPDGYDLLGNIYMSEKKYVLHYINLPVQLLFSTGIKFGHVWIGSGPYGGILVGGHYKTSNIKVKLLRGNELSDDFKNFDYGISSSLGLRLNNGFLLDIEQNFGLADVTPGMQKSRNTSWSFCIGYVIK